MVIHTYIGSLKVKKAGKVSPINDVDDEAWVKQAEKVNIQGKFLLILVTLACNGIFWICALKSYFSGKDPANWNIANSTIA